MANETPVPEARVGYFRVYLDPNPDPDGGATSWVVEDTRDGVAQSDWFTYSDAIGEAMRLDRDAPAPVVSDHPLAPAHLLNILGRGNGRGPGITELNRDYPTVILDQLGAVAMRTQPRGELGIYLELGGRFNKREDRDERGYILAVGQTAELMAELVVAGQAGGPVFSRELEAAIARKQRERGLVG